MPTPEEMRKAIRGAYQSERWWARVAKMSEAQVFVIYQKFVAEKKI